MAKSQRKKPPQATGASASTSTNISRVEKVLDTCLTPIDIIGKRLMGDLWRTLYLSIQDAIALGILLKVPGVIFQTFTGESFSSFETCLQRDYLSIDRYACFIIVASDFLLWIVLAGRIIGRFLADFSNLLSQKSN